jgi:hypothetical protein
MKRGKAAPIMGIGGWPSGHAAPDAAFALDDWEIGSPNALEVPF